MTGFELGLALMIAWLTVYWAGLHPMPAEYDLAVPP